MDFHDSLQGVLHDCSAAGGPCGRNTNAEWERLGRAFSEILGTCKWHVAFIQHVFLALVFLEPLVVGKRNPNQFVPAFYDARFDLYSFGLDIFFTLDVHFARNGFSFLKSCFIEGNPDLTFGMS